MAFLIPLLLPHIVEASANIGIGISNAIQGDTSNVSFQVGKKVFSTRKSFNFGSLPPELRVRILIEALEESVSYIKPQPFIIDPLSARLYELQRQVPLHQDSTSYRSIYGDTISANGYPISSWRWQGVCKEWREELRGGLWKNLEVVGFRPWANLLSMIEGKKGAEILKLAKTITLREGFESTSDLYAILSCRELDSLEAISILPDYPTPFHPLVPPIPTFSFGFQLIRTQKDRLKSLTYGLPLESTTNEASRQQLSILRPKRLTLSFVRPTIALFKELETLVGDHTEHLSIRYIPAGSGRLVPPSVLLCDHLQTFAKVEIFLYLPRGRVELPGPFSTSTVPREDPPAVSEFIASVISALEVETDEAVKKRYTIWRVEDWAIPGMVSKATKTRLWPEVSEEEERAADVAEAAMKEKAVADEKEKASGSREVTSGLKGKQPEKPRDHWDRETNLRLLGGLVNLRLESKKH